MTIKDDVYNDPDHAMASFAAEQVRELEAENARLKAELTKARIENNHNWQANEFAEEMAAENARLKAELSELNSKDVDNLFEELRWRT